MTDYRYIFGTLRDEKIVAEIPLTGTYMDLELNVGGRFDGTFHLDDIGDTIEEKRINNQIWLDATIPGRTFVAVERAGTPVWLGFVWSRVYQSQSKSVQLYAQSFENYPQYQEVETDFLMSSEQLAIFKELWTRMQSTTGRNINVIVPSAVPPTIVTRTIEVLATDHKNFGEVISSFADGTDGFDWYIGVNRTGNTYLKTLVYGYPTIGNPDPGKLTFEYPGPVLNYYATETMSTSATNIFTLGAGEGSSMLVYESTQNTMISQGFPRWDMTVSRKDIDNQSLLNEIGAREGLKRKPPMLVVKTSMKGDLSPGFGSFGLGDACNVTINDARFPNGFTFNGRIVKWTLQPTSSDTTEEYTVLFEGDDESG
jgi:hypothetical protein